MAENDVVAEARAALARLSGRRWTLDRFTSQDARFVANAPDMVARLADECERLRAGIRMAVDTYDRGGSVAEAINIVDALCPGKREEY